MSKKEQVVKDYFEGARTDYLSVKYGLSLDDVKGIQHEACKDRNERLIEKPIIKRKDIGLVSKENGAFDIPTILPSVAIDYFSGEISFEQARRKLIKANHWVANSSEDELLAELKNALIGAEKYYEYIIKEM